MSVVAVVNRKGGSGKSTLATHLAVYCAKSNFPVMLGDTDRNLSTQVWMQKRSSIELPPSASLVGRRVDPRNLLRPPAGTEHVVLDTPGGLQGFELGRIVCHADVIIMPVSVSLFDRNAAADCWAELKQLPRVSSGRCQVAVVGMRLETRAKAEQQFRQWAASQGLPVIGTLRQSLAYVRSIEQGLTLFDLPGHQVAADLQQWEPILAWLRPLLASKPSGAQPSLKPSYRPVDGSASKPAGASILGPVLPHLPRPTPAVRLPQQRTPAPLLASASWSNRFSQLWALPLRRFLVSKP